MSSFSFVKKSLWILIIADFKGEMTYIYEKNLQRLFVGV